LSKLEREKPSKNILCWAFFIVKIGKIVTIAFFLYIEEDI